MTPRPDRSSSTATFVCPGCGDEEFPDEAGVVTCDECGAHIETLEPLGLRRILPNYWSRLRGSSACDPAQRRGAVLTAAQGHEVEGTVPSQWWLDLKAENQRLRTLIEQAAAEANDGELTDGTLASMTEVSEDG